MQIAMFKHELVLKEVSAKIANGKLQNSSTIF